MNRSPPQTTALLESSPFYGKLKLVTINIQALRCPQTCKDSSHHPSSHRPSAPHIIAPWGCTVMDKASLLSSKKHLRCYQLLNTTMRALQRPRAREGNSLNEDKVRSNKGNREKPGRETRDTQKGQLPQQAVLSP